MSTVTPLRRRGQNPDTADSKVRPMHNLQLTSAIRIDLERIRPDRRRAVLFDLVYLREHSAATVYVGDLTRPDPTLIDPLVEALVRSRIFLHVEGTPAAREAWCDDILSLVDVRCGIHGGSRS